MATAPHKKKLLFVITKGSWGGAGRYVYDLAVSLKDRYDITVAIGGGGMLVQKLKHEHVRTRIVPALARDIDIASDVRAFLELLKLFREEKPDIVHLNSSKAGALGAVAGRIARIRHIVYTAHGWVFNEPVSTLSKVFRWLVSLVTMLCAHRTITVSHFDTLLSPIKSRAQTVHNGIHPIDFIPRDAARKEICERAHIPEDAFIFGAMSELHVNKGIDILIEATYLVDNIQVVVMGEGEERSELEKLIKELSLEERVHLIGFVENSARYLKAFDAFVLPSRKEGLPYAVLEAGIAEVPVIASAVGGVPEIIIDQICGDLVHAFNDLALAESLKEFTENPNTLTHYREALSERIRRYFNFDDMVRHTAEIYES